LKSERNLRIKNGPATQDSVERRQEGREAGEGRQGRRQAQEEAKGDLLGLHLQGAQAGAPGHGRLLQGHVHHELVRERHLRAHRGRGLAPRHPQRPLDHLVARNPDLGASAAAGRARQARRLRGHQGRHQVHQLQVDLSGCVSPFLFVFVNFFFCMSCKHSLTYLLLFIFSRLYFRSSKISKNDSFFVFVFSSFRLKKI